MTDNKPDNQPECMALAVLQEGLDQVLKVMGALIDRNNMFYDGYKSAYSDIEQHGPFITVTEHQRLLAEAVEAAYREGWGCRSRNNKDSAWTVNLHWEKSDAKAGMDGC